MEITGFSDSGSFQGFLRIAGTGDDIFKIHQQFHGDNRMKMCSAVSLIVAFSRGFKKDQELSNRNVEEFT